MRIRQAAVSAISITDGRIGRPSIHGDEALDLPTPVGQGGGSEAFLGRCEFGDQMGRRIRETGRGAPGQIGGHKPNRSEEQTSDLQSLMRTSYAVCCLKQKT